MKTTIKLSLAPLLLTLIFLVSGVHHTHAQVVTTSSTTVIGYMTLDPLVHDSPENYWSPETHVKFEGAKVPIVEWYGYYQQQTGANPLGLDGVWTINYANVDDNGSYYEDDTISYGPNYSCFYNYSRIFPENIVYIDSDCGIAGMFYGIKSITLNSKNNIYVGCGDDFLTGPGTWNADDPELKDCTYDTSLWAMNHGIVSDGNVFNYLFVTQVVTPPLNLRAQSIGKLGNYGTELDWTPSTSTDQTAQYIERATSTNPLDIIDTVGPTTDSYIDQPKPFGISNEAADYPHTYQIAAHYPNVLTDGSTEDDLSDHDNFNNNAYGEVVTSSPPCLHITGQKDISGDKIVSFLRVPPYYQDTEKSIQAARDAAANLLTEKPYNKDVSGTIYSFYLDIKLQPVRPQPDCPGEYYNLVPAPSNLTATFDATTTGYVDLSWQNNDDLYSDHIVGWSIERAFSTSTDLATTTDFTKIATVAYNWGSYSYVDTKTVAGITDPKIVGVIYRVRAVYDDYGATSDYSNSASISTAVPIVITVGGIHTSTKQGASLSGVFNWVNGVLPPLVNNLSSGFQIQDRGNSSGKIISLIRKDIDLILSENHPVIVVAHSMGTFEAYSAAVGYSGDTGDYTDDNVRFVYVDPPYEFIANKIGLAPGGSDSVNYFKTYPSNMVDWTYGKAFGLFATNLKFHDAFDWPNYYDGMAPNGNYNATNLEDLKQIILQNISDLDNIYGVNGYLKVSENNTTDFFSKVKSVYELIASISKNILLSSAINSIIYNIPSIPEIKITGLTDSTGAKISSINPDDTITINGSFDPNGNNIEMQNLDNPDIYYDFYYFAPDSAANNSLTFTLPEYYDFTDLDTIPNTVPGNYVVKVASINGDWADSINILLSTTSTTTSTSTPPVTPPTTASTTYTLIETTPVNKILYTGTDKTFQLTGLSPNSSYCAILVATYPSGTTATSSEVCVNTQPSPSSPIPAPSAPPVFNVSNPGTVSVPSVGQDYVNPVDVGGHSR